MNNQIRLPQPNTQQIQLINSRTALSQIKAVLPSSKISVIAFIQKVFTYIKLISQIISIIEEYEKVNPKLKAPN